MILPKNISSPEHPRDGGFAIIALVVTLLMLFAFLALAIDAGYAYVERRRMHAATDAAALTGAWLMVRDDFDNSSPSNSDAADVISTARAAAAANGLPSAIITAGGGIQVGYWNRSISPPTFTPNGTPVNAVEVRARRTLPLRFSAVNHYPALSPHVRSIASVEPAGAATCVLPFGIERHLVEEKEFGDTILVDRQSPGDWGKLDICASDEPVNCMSAGPRFEEAMRTNVCLERLEEGSTVSPGTGFAGIKDAFEERLANNPLITVAVVQEFPEGNSSDALIVDFISGIIQSVSGSGNNWEIEIELTDAAQEGGGGGSVGPEFKARELVL